MKDFIIDLPQSKMYYKMIKGSDNVCDGRVAENIMVAGGNTGRDDETGPW